jgi:uncharacterized membrane protein
MIGTVFRSVRDFLRSNFIAGMFIAVPFAITVVFLVWVWGKVDVPLRQIFDVALTPDGMPWQGAGSAIDNSEYRRLLIPAISASLVLLCVLILGILTRSIIGRMFLGGLEGLVGRLPVIGMLYMSLKQLGEAFVTTDGKSKFQRAVAVQFPHKDCWAIGFVTGEGATFMPKSANSEMAPKKMLTVFVPTTPLPTAGFLMAVAEKDTIPLEMSVQDALKMVVSGGILNPGESTRVKPETGITRIMVRESESKLNLKNPGTVEH